jgi:hypothetical protein
MSDAMFPCRSVLPSSPRKRGSILIFLHGKPMDSRLRGNDEEKLLARLKCLWILLRAEHRLDVGCRPRIPDVGCHVSMPIGVAVIPAQAGIHFDFPAWKAHGFPLRGNDERSCWHAGSCSRTSK